MQEQSAITPADVRSLVSRVRADRELDKELKERRDALAKPEAKEALEKLTANAVEEGVAFESVADEDLEFESIVLREGRPVLPVRNNLVFAERDDPNTFVWSERLRLADAHLKRVIPLVGRVEVNNHPNLPWVGTGWVIDDGMIVTNRHVAVAFAQRDNAKFVFRPGADAASPMTARIDFLEEIGGAEASEFPIAEVIWISSEPGPDVAFLKLADGAARTDKIPLASTAPSAQMNVAVIGYPARDGRVPDAELMDRIYGGIYNKKRLAPGQLIAGESADLVFHDCTTLGGNSGSVVLDLASGAAVALHFSGKFLKENRAVPAAVLRGLLRDQPWNGPGVSTAAAV